MPQIQDNNKGQPKTVAGVSTGVNYEPFVGGHYLCNEGATTGLVDVVAAANMTIQGGSVPVIAGGAQGAARGPCNGFIGAGGDGFQRTVVGGGPFDCQQSTITQFTFMGWGRLQAGHGATQEYASNNLLANPASARAWVLRGVQDLGGGLEGPVFLGWDGSAFTLSTGLGYTAGIPHNVWYMLGFSMDFTVAGNGKFVGYVGIPGTGEFSVTIDPVPANMFSHTSPGAQLIGIDTGLSSGGQGFEIDHITTLLEYAVTDEAEFSLFYNEGVPLDYVNGGFDLSVASEGAGGRVVHNDHGSTGGNNHGAGSNRQ